MGRALRERQEVTALQRRLARAESEGPATVQVGALRAGRYTVSTAAPTTTQYPVSGDWGFHRDTGGAALYLVFNDGGVIKKFALT